MMDLDWRDRPRTVYDWKRFIALVGCNDFLRYPEVFLIENAPFNFTFVVPSDWDIELIVELAEAVREINLVIRVEPTPW